MSATPVGSENPAKPAGAVGKSRYFVVACSYRPTAPNARSKPNRLMTPRELQNFRTAIDALPLPESYLDVPPSGEAQLEQFEQLAMFTLEEAMKVAATSNRRAVAVAGRGIKDATFEWSVVAMLGEPLAVGAFAEAAERNGVVEISTSYAISIVEPSAEMRRRQGIDWSSVLRAKGGVS